MHQSHSNFVEVDSYYWKWRSKNGKFGSRSVLMRATCVCRWQKSNYSNKFSGCLCCSAWLPCGLEGDLLSSAEPCVATSRRPTSLLLQFGRSEIISHRVGRVVQVSIGACRVPGFICNEDEPQPTREERRHAGRVMDKL